MNNNRQWLIDLRNKSNLKQTDIANAVGISGQQYSAIERGFRNPSTSVAKRIAAFLGFPWTLFYEDISE